MSTSDVSSSLQVHRTGGEDSRAIHSPTIPSPSPAAKGPIRERGLRDLRLGPPLPDPLPIVRGRLVLVLRPRPPASPSVLRSGPSTRFARGPVQGWGGGCSRWPFGAGCVRVAGPHVAVIERKPERSSSFPSRSLDVLSGPRYARSARPLAGRHARLPTRRRVVESRARRL